MPSSFFQVTCHNGRDISAISQRLHSLESAQLWWRCAQPDLVLDTYLISEYTDQAGLADWVADYSLDGGLVDRSTEPTSLNLSN